MRSESLKADRALVRKQGLIRAFETEIIEKLDTASYPYLVVQTGELIYRYLGKGADKYAAAMCYLMSGKENIREALLEFYFRLIGQPSKYYKN